MAEFFFPHIPAQRAPEHDGSSREPRVDFFFGEPGLPWLDAETEL